MLVDNWRLIIPRGVYVRKNGKKNTTVIIKSTNPIQALANEVVALKKKATTAKSKRKYKLRSSDDYDKYDQMKMEHEQIKEYVSTTRRVLSDRVNTIIILLENLKSNL